MDLWLRRGQLLGVELTDLQTLYDDGYAVDCFHHAILFGLL